MSVMHACVCVASPSSVATQARMASRAAVLSPGEGEAEGMGRQMPRRQGHTETVSVPVLLRPEPLSRRTTGTCMVREEAGERGRVFRGDRSSTLAVGPERSSRGKERE